MPKTCNCTHIHATCDIATDLTLRNKKKLVSSITLNSYQKRKKQLCSVFRFYMLIIKYTITRKKFLFYLSIDKNQLNLHKGRGNFPQINLCFHVLYVLFLLLPQHPLQELVKLMLICTHHPYTFTVWCSDTCTPEFFMEVTIRHCIPINLNAICPQQTSP